MNELINKEFKQGLITIAAKANVGKTTFLCSLASEAIKENKKILFLSLEKSKKSLLEHIKVDKMDNLIVEDKPIYDLDTLREIIIENNIDIILVDYLQLLPDNAITILKEISHAKNIPIIVGYQLFSGNKQDISTVDLSKFENQNKNAILTTNVSDILGFMYCEPSTERKLIILKNNYGELKDIILN